MRESPVPVVKDVVLLGGGHAHVAVLRRFGMKPEPGVRLTVISREVHTPYSGMLPGFIAGHYALDDCHIDLRPLARFAGARLFHDEAVGLDLAQRQVICAGRPPVPYDLLSLDIGSTPALDPVPGAAEHTVAVKPIGRFVQHWDRLVARVHGSGRPVAIAVVGGGAGGVELALAVRHRLGAAPVGGVGSVRALLCLVTETPDILPSYPARVRKIFRRVLAARGIAVHAGRRVIAAEEGHLVLHGGARLPADEVLWVTQAAAQGWLRDTGLALDDDGFVRVEATLRSVSHPEVFAAGDVAAIDGARRPKAGVFAVRAGPPLADNLRNAALGRTLRRWRPQKRYLSLISTGDRYAVAARGRFAAEGAWLWRLKDWIDRRWMRKYIELPEMAAEAAPAVAEGLADADALAALSALAMRCGGCGAKVGATVLSRVMGELQPLARPDVLIGLDSPDDAAVLSVPPGKVAVQTVDHFRAFVDDPYVFGRIAANHALGDIYAMGAEPQGALAIATVPYGIEAKVEDTLRALMQGALATLSEAGCALVGGHTGEGAELALGFAVTGLADPARILRKGGIRPGDALLLTRPIGTGALFAADMRGRAKGRWIDAALAQMARSGRAAAAILLEHGATACTDVTGFGLLGHLVEMTRASNVDVELRLDHVKHLDGALDCAAAGIFSSLQPQNVRLRRAVRDGERFAADPRYALLFDPQTAGGLLASVPAERAEACLAALHAAGETDAAIIGRALAPDGQDGPVRIV